MPTAYVAPILAKLQTELSLLEDILETDLAPIEETVAGYTLWFLASAASSEHKAMRNELDAVRSLGRRIRAIKYTAIEFAARGQRGVREGSKEEKNLDASKL